jgi:integrase
LAEVTNHTMSENVIRVSVVKYPDRKFLMMRYVDPITGKSVARSTKATNHRDAERAAAKWEAELQAGTYHKPQNISWAEFRQRCEDEKLAALSPNTMQATIAAFNHVERLIHPKSLHVLTPQVLSQFQAKLRNEKMRETTIATHLRHLRAALGWAVSMSMLAKLPEIKMPKRAKGLTLMRGRPITGEEFERMLTAVTSVRPRDAQTWIHYLNGLWLSGLRLEESLQLGWDEDSPLSIVLGGRHPKLRIYAEAEKGHLDRLLPMTPDFAEFLMRTPPEKRTGAVFRIAGLQTGRPMTAKRICRIISKIGEKAGVVVNRSEDKFASAHDLRRAFGTRWASRVKPATLKLLMRHQSIDTTLKYYVAQDADEIADELWQEYGPKSIKQQGPGRRRRAAK